MMIDPKRGADEREGNRLWNALIRKLLNKSVCFHSVVGNGKIYNAETIQILVYSV